MSNPNPAPLTYNARTAAGYPYSDIMSGVLGTASVADGLKAHSRWANLGWTMDYATEAARAGAGLKDSRAILGLLILAGCR